MVQFCSYFHNTSVIYSNNAFIVLDAEWPDEYITSVLNQTNVNYVIHNKQQVLFYSVLSLDSRIFLFSEPKSDSRVLISKHVIIICYK